MSHEVVSARIIRNTIANSIGQATTMAVAFLLTPYIVNRLGVETYGVWVLALAAVSYLSLADLGLGAALLKYVPEYSLNPDDPNLASLLQVAAISLTGIALVMGAGVWLIGDWLLSVISLDVSLQEARLVLAATDALLVLTLLSGLPQSMLLGLQRMGVVNAVLVATTALNVVATVVALETGYGLHGLMLSRILMLAAGLVALVWLARRLVPRPVHSLVRFRVAAVKLLRYGLRVQMTNLAAVVHLQTSKVLLGYFAGMATVAIYDVGFRVAFTAGLIPLVLVSAITPAASEFQARHDNELLIGLYTRGSRYVALAGLLVLTLVTVAAPVIVRAWMGPGFSASVRVVQILALGFMINLLLTGVGTTIARGIGQPGEETRYGLIVIAIDLTLGVVLTARAGLDGALAATLVASTVGSIYFLVRFHRLTRLPLPRYAVATLGWPLLAALVAGFPVHVVNLVADHLALPPDRLPSLALLLLQGVIFCTIYSVIVLRSHYLNETDWTLLSRWWPQRLRQMIRPVNSV